MLPRVTCSFEIPRRIIEETLDAKAVSEGRPGHHASYRSTAPAIRLVELGVPFGEVISSLTAIEHHF